MRCILCLEPFTVRSIDGPYHPSYNCVLSGCFGEALDGANLFGFRIYEYLYKEEIPLNLLHLYTKCPADNHIMCIRIYHHDKKKK
jgi:hypothetical protein